MLATLNTKITGIKADSRKVVAGDAFLAYLGEKVDGRRYIAQAIENGASAVLWDAEDFIWKPEWQVANLAVPNLKAKSSEIAGDFYGHPSQQLWVMGVTGTNGKTSISHWLAGAFNVLQRKTAVLGTVGNGFMGGLNVAVNTTPDAVALQKMLAEFVLEGASDVAIEVSSHGLDQGRVNGVQFDVAIFTNLSRDHLDYHPNMAAYGAAKAKLFAFDSLKTCVVNTDDAFGNSLATQLKAQGKQVFSYGLESGDVRGECLQLHLQGLTMQVQTPYGHATLTAPVLGAFNAYNLLAVLATLLASNIQLTDAMNAIAQLKPVLGRMQTLGGETQPLVVVDYAHTPDALEKVLVSLKAHLADDAKLLCVFGCGGNRDAGKRPLMGAIASEHADAVIVTTDNPRNEDAEEIIKQIIQPISKAVMVEIDRQRAIQIAVLSAKAGDIVLIAGKGHEDYQEVKGMKTHFSDVEHAQKSLELYDALYAEESWLPAAPQLNGSGSSR